MRKINSFDLNDPSSFKQKLLQWAQKFDNIIFLDNNGHHDNYGSFEAAIAIGVESQLKTNQSDALEALSYYKDKTKDWIFGYLTYDLKNELEDLNSQNHDDLEFEMLHFFQPQKLIFLKEGRAEFHYLKEYAKKSVIDYNAILSVDFEHYTKRKFTTPKIKLRIHKDAYLNKINCVLREIQIGSIYEVNICQEFFSEKTIIDPLKTFNHLNKISNPPFSAFLKLNDRYALCASPERYLKRIGSKIISTPIKGTAARSKILSEDVALKEGLAKDPKELAENIMITDLVRNDLSKSALRGTVQVEELCKVYTFKQVHQMISTITSKIDTTLNSVQLLKDTYPMGSMTGAPKVAAMKIIEKFEETKRGLYSGSIGYFDPDDNFDFNVIIRTILYNAKKKYVSYSVGSAITSKSDPQKEYQECLLKAKAMRSVLEQK